MHHLFEYLPVDLGEALKIRQADFSQGTQLAQARASALTYISERFGDCTLSFLTGSYAERTPTILSDVDLVVIDNRLPRALREQLLYNSYPLQVLIMSTFTALSYIESDKNSGNFTLLQAFISADYLSGDISIFELLKNSAGALALSGPKPRHSQTEQRARAAVINNYLKLFRPVGEAERFGFCVKLVRSIAKYLQICDATWITNEVRYEPKLRESSEYGRIISTVPAALSGDVSAILSETHALLLRRGEVVWSSGTDGPLVYEQ